MIHGYLENKAIGLLDGIPEKHANIIKRIGNGFTRLTWTIAKFLITLWIFNRVYDRVGFEETIIILLVLVAVLIMSQGRKDFLK